VITGAGGSVAPVVALEFLRHGAKVTLVSRTGKERETASRLKGAAELEGAGRLLVVGADLADETSAQQALRDAAARMGRATVLVNMAGGYAARKAVEAGLSGLEEQLSTNLRTAVNATLAALPSMLEAGDGAILALGAGAAHSPAPGSTAYAAAKAALAAYFRSLAAEVAAGGVSVGVLHPMGAIDTSANRLAMPQADTSKWIRPAAVAEALLYLAGGEAGGRVRELEMFGG